MIDLDLFEARSSNEQQRAQDYGFDTVDDSAGDADKVGDSADDSDCADDSCFCVDGGKGEGFGGSFWE